MNGSPALPLRVVVGPRTRVGRELVAASTGPVRLVVRDDRDRADLSPLLTGGVTALDVAERDPARLLDDGGGPVHVVVCALGPVHPDADDDPGSAADAWARDRDAVHRDLELVAALLDAAGDRPVHVVLVSTVLALAPGDDRRYYGGWKNLVDAALGAQVARRGHVDDRYSVLYPGRLVETSAPAWRTFVHTAYPKLVTLVVGLLEGHKAPRVVGRDARMWLVARSFRFLVGGVRPSPARVTRLGGRRP